MIDARLWARPPPDEIRAMVHSLRKGRTVKETAAEIAARLGRGGGRSVLRWMSPKQEPGRSISYCEWYLLNEIVKKEAR